MFAMLWLFFILLNGKWTLEIAVIGLAVALLGTLFAGFFMGWSLRKEIKLIARLPAYVVYALNLLWEILKANLATIRLIYRPKQPEAAIVTFKTPLKTGWAKVLLADSITLTPGTITLDCTEDHLSVHCLDKAFGEGLADSDMEHRIEKLEAK